MGQSAVGVLGAWRIDGSDQAAINVQRQHRLEVLNSGSLTQDSEQLTQLAVGFDAGGLGGLNDAVADRTGFGAGRGFAILAETYERLAEQYTRSHPSRHL